MTTNPLMDGTSLNPQSELLVRLQSDFPEIFSDGKVDPDKLKSTLGDFVDMTAERYGLSWAGKSDCFRHIQEPTTETLRPDKESSVDWDTTKNLFIEGDNLETLKVLQKAYYGKVKMIYIDPPYNTGSDSFVYPDKFQESKADYEARAGKLDEEGNLTRDGFWRKNTKDNGHYHSNWLSMIYPRLFLARNLLRQDGIVFVSIDDNEVHNLRMVMDEIFGEENFIGDILWHSTKSVTNTALISVSHTYNLVYARNIEHYTENRHEFRLPESWDGFSNPDNDPRGPWKADPFQVGGWRPNQQYEIVNPVTGTVYLPSPGNSWKNEFSKFQELLADNRIVFWVSGEAGPQRKRFLSEALERGRVTTTLWNEIDTTTNATKSLKELLGGTYFSNPKPTELVRQFAQLCTRKDDIICDFFAGSWTTAQAIMELNASEELGSRRWIAIQLPEILNPDDKEQKAAHDFLVSLNKPANISELAKERIRRAWKKVKDENPGKNLDIGFRAFKLSPSCFKQWQTLAYSEEELQQQMLDFVDTSIPGASEEDQFFELLIKSGYDPHTSVEKCNGYYFVQQGELAIVLGKIDQVVSREILAKKPTKVISLDTSFGGNDVLKTNILIEAEGAGVEWKVI